MQFLTVMLAAQGFTPYSDGTLIWVAKLIGLAIVGLVLIVLVDKIPEKKKK